MMFEFTGIMAAMHTPMHSDGSLNLDAIPQQVAFLLDAGVNGLFACGTTGEFPSLTIQERRFAADAVVRAAAGRVPVIIHVGHNCLKDAQALAFHARAIGADGIAAAAPSYFKPGDIKTLIGCCAYISQGAPDLPFFYYHIPVFNSVSVSIVDLLREAEVRLPSLKGIKFSSPELDAFVDCLDTFQGRYSLMYGRDEMLLPALVAGATAAVGSTYNYAAPLYLQMWNAFTAGDIDTAQHCQRHVVQFANVQKRFGGVRSSKQMMKLVGVDCGPVRLPIKPFTDEEEQALEGELTDIGFFEWRNGIERFDSSSPSTCGGKE